MHEDKPTNGCKGSKTIWGKLWEQNEYNRKAKTINNMGKELQCLDEGPEGDIYLESLRTTLKKVPNWKIPGPDGIRGFWF